MANRQNAGKSGKGRDGKPDKQIFEQNQLGLKEAFAILQRDFLELKKAYIGKEQELVEVQERYFILDQSYQELQQDCQDQQAKLVKQLEKSYEAYNEKFTRVEELEEKLSECNKNLEKINQRKENQEAATYVQEQINFQRHVFEEAVRKSLANVGLSLATVGGNFQIEILDYKKFKQWTGYKDDFTTGAPSKNLKTTELEKQNVLLQQTLLSLKDYSNKQQDQLTRTTDLLEKKTEECLKLQRGAQWQGSKRTIAVETKTLEGIVFGLSEMSDFIVQLKKTICDQNSWIDVLAEALNEYRKSRASYDEKNKTAVAGVPVLGTANHHGASGQNSVSGKKNKSKKKTKSAGREVDGKQAVNCSTATSEIPSSNEMMNEFQGYVIVPSSGRSTFEADKTVKSSVHSLPVAFSSQTETRASMNKNPKSVHHQSHQMSSLNLNEKTKVWGRIQTDSPEHLPGAAVNANTCLSKQKQVATTDEMCPVCNLIFEKNLGLEKRTSHINSHFED